MRVACGQGAMAESPDLLVPAFESGADYVVCDSLAEATTSMLALDRRADEAKGFAPDLASRLAIALPYVAERGTRFITNAGGVNPIAAHQLAVAAARPFRGLRIGLVCADVGLGREVYLGAAGVVQALEEGADVVVTGRVADAALFLAPVVHEQAWAWDDWDRLAAGVVVGHLLECSGQVTGGNYSGRWWENPDPLRIAFPIAEVEAGGEAVITKPAGTGGMVTFDTVREQLLYEVHDPAKYLNPDVTADFTSLTLDDLGGDRVRVSGTRGAPPPAAYKGLVCTPAGWAGEARLSYPWPDAEAKARAALAFIRRRAEAAGLPIDEWVEEYFGVNAYGGPTVPDLDAWEPPEVIGRLAWRAADQKVVAAVGQGSGVLGLSGPPTISGVGRTRDGGPTQLLAVTPFAVDRAVVDAQIRIDVERV